MSIIREILKKNGICFKSMKLLDQVRITIRTEHAYIPWIKKFIHFHHIRHPKDMGKPGVATNVYFAETGDKIQADFGALGTVDLELV